MAVLYLLLILYFKATGGYQRVDIGKELPPTDQPIWPEKRASDHPFGITEKTPPSSDIKQ
jgi:hypothetical protein